MDRKYGEELVEEARTTSTSVATALLTIKNKPVVKGETFRPTIVGKGETFRQTIVVKGETFRQTIVVKGETFRQTIVVKGETFRQTFLSELIFLNCV